MTIRLTALYKQAQITASAIPDVFLFGDHVFSESPALPTVPLDKIQRIVKRANRCELRMEDEASWNMEVHHHILRTICRPQGQPGLVDFISWYVAVMSLVPSLFSFPPLSIRNALS